MSGSRQFGQVGARMFATGIGVPLAHVSTHQNGGADEISVLGLSGLLADAQTALKHSRGRTTISTAAAIALTGGSTWDTLTATAFTSSYLSNFTESGGVLTYTGAGEIVMCFAQVAGILASSNQVMTLGISQNNADPIALSQIPILQTAGANTQRYSATVCFADLAINDTLRVKIMISTAGQNFTPVTGSSLTVIGLG